MTCHTIEPMLASPHGQCVRSKQRPKSPWVPDPQPDRKLLGPCALWARPPPTVTEPTAGSMQSPPASPTSSFSGDIATVGLAIPLWHDAGFVTKPTLAMTVTLPAARSSLPGLGLTEAAE